MSEYHRREGEPGFYSSSSGHTERLLSQLLKRTSLLHGWVSQILFNFIIEDRVKKIISEETRLKNLQSQLPE